MSQDLVVVLYWIVLNRVVRSLLQYGEDVSVDTARWLIKVVDIGSQHDMLLVRELPIETECPFIKRVLDTAACIVRQAARRVAAKRECPSSRSFTAAGLNRAGFTMLFTNGPCNLTGTALKSPFSIAAVGV
jgi:hypothetical protein